MEIESLKCNLVRFQDNDITYTKYKEVVLRPLHLEFPICIKEHKAVVLFPLHH